MKTIFVNVLMMLSLPFLLVACSKTETNDMMFKEAVSEASSATPSPGESSDPTQDPSVVIVNDEPKVPEAVVVVTNPAPVVEKAPETPKAPEAPKAPEVVKAPEAPKAPEVVKAPEAPKAPEVVKAPEAPKAPEVVKAPEAPKAPACEEKEKEIIYPESEIPDCKLNVKFNGAGSASRVAITSSSKSELMKNMAEGFETLSSAELEAMRKAVDTMTSANGVQVLKNGADFDKKALPKGAKVLLVTDGKGSSLNINGIGKNAEVYVMNVVDQHSTVCLQANGITDSSKLFMVVKGDSKYVSRGLVNVNGSGSNMIYMKVIGGNQTGSTYEGNGMSDATLMMITEGKNDTFNSITANGITDSKITLKIKGKDDTGMGIKSNGIKDSVIRMEMEGEDSVKAMMDVNGMSGNEVSGWLKAKSGGKVDPLMEEFIELMPLP